MDDIKGFYSVVNCPFSDSNNDFCCSTALHEKECLDNCFECCLKMISDISSFLYFLNQKEGLK